jgi:hypothetical protein
MSDERSSGGRKRRPATNPPPANPLGLSPEVLEAFRRRSASQQTPPATNPPPANPLGLSPEVLEAFRRRSASQQTPPATNPPLVLNPRSRGLPGGVPNARALTPARKINLARCYVTGVTNQEKIETFLSEERKIYPNNSKVATLTKEVSISNSIVRTVTVESSKLRAHNAEAGVTLFGFATIQGQVQQQLNERYSVTTENSISISEKTTIQVPPASTVEHVIQWKLVSLNGIAVLGESAPSPSSYNLAEVPYQVPLRLTYTETLNDVRQIRESRG